MPLFSSAAQKLRARPYHVAAAVLLAGIGGLFYLPYLGSMPVGLHTWAQSDRLALAINYYDYGFQFFKPRTSTLTSIGGITGVEFPIQAYLAALGGLVFGRGQINLLFRLLDVLIALTGFFYLFRLIFERTNHFVAALVPACFLLSSPVFAFYAGNYVPDPASLSLSFVGYYYWLRFFEQRRFRDLLLALAVLTLASLIKTTTALFLTAALGITFGWVYFQPELLTSRQKRWFAAVAVGGVGLIIGFFYHNQHLNSYYQSGLFLAEARPIKDAAMLHSVVRFVYQHWVREYATVTLYHVMTGCVVLFVGFVVPNLRRRLPLMLLIGAAAALAYFIFQLMGQQFMAHDYYIVCSVGPLVVLLLVAALLNLGHFGGWYKWATSLGLAVLAVVLLHEGYQRLEQRMQEDRYAWLRDSGPWLTAAGVPPQAPILFVGDDAPNTALVYADRRGIVWTVDSKALNADNIAAKMAADSLEYALLPPPVYDALGEKQEALKTRFAIVMEQPFRVLRRLDMHQPW